MSLRPLLIGALALALAACAAPLPNGLSAADVAAFSAGMEKAGCTVQSDQTAAIVEEHTGFDETKLAALTDYLLETGALAEAGSGIRLTTGTCANA